MPESDIRKSEKGGNTAYLNMGAWYDDATDQIHLTLPHSGWVPYDRLQKPE